jgi:hypothetical protein
MKALPLLLSSSLSKMISLPVTKLETDIFTIPVKIGTPQQEFNLALSFELGELFVTQEGCRICNESDTQAQCNQSKKMCKPNNFYNVKASSTGKIYNLEDKNFHSD